MSELKVDRLTPQSGEFIEIGGRVRFTEPLAGITNAAVNDIGMPGQQGFGVGIAPNAFPGFSPLAGTNDPASANYGNYRYTDGSIMCWIPAFWYKFGTGANGLAVNRVDVKPFSMYASVGAAEAAGYALPRAFYEGGVIKSGFFIDKFACSNNNSIASSIQFRSPLSTSSARNPISALTGAPANNYGGTLAAAKTRGAIFHTATIFQRHGVLALLAKAHGDASSSTAFNAWYLPGANFPKGNNSNALSDVNDPLLSFVNTGESGFPATALTGSGSVLAKTTHNGQECGVVDVNGNVWDVTPGFSSDGSSYFIAGISISQNSFTSANAFGAPAGWTNVGSTFGYAGNFLGSPTQRFGNGANQVLEAATSGNLWLQASAGIARQLGVSSAGTSEFGQDFAFDGRPNLLAPVSGGNWDSGSGAGVFALSLLDTSGNSNVFVGFRACSFGS
jgi:hypothetical protein